MAVFIPLRCVRSLLGLVISVLWLSVGAIAQESPKPNAIDGTPNLAELSFGDWLYRCSEPSSMGGEGQQRICELSQSVMIKAPGGGEGSQTDELVEILNLTVLRANDKADKVKWALVVLTPLDVHLSSDFGLRIGDSKMVLARYRNCNHQGCWVVVPIDDDALDGLKKSAEAVGAFQLISGQDVNVSFSLMGFTKALNALEAGIAPPDQRSAAQ